MPLPLKILNNADPGDADRAGGDDFDLIANTLNNNYPSAADFTVYIEGSTIKARNNALQTVPYSHATDLGNVLNSIHGALSATTGGTVEVKSGAYGWATKLSITKQFVGIKCEIGTTITPGASYADDLISVEKNDFSLTDGYFDCSSMANGSGSWLVIGTTTNSDRPRIYRNRVKSAPTHGVQVGSHCNGLWLIDNSIQSFAAPTGHGVLLSSSADHKVYGNHIGGYPDGTNGCGVAISGCSNMILENNEIFTNRVGVNLYLPSSILVLNNLIQANTQNGIIIKNDSATTYKKSIISNNRIHDNGTSAADTYDGITFSITSTGLLDDITVVGNTITDTSTNQRYGININTNKLTNSCIVGNALAGNHVGAMNIGTIDSTLVISGNSGGVNSSGLLLDATTSTIKVPYLFGGSRAVAANATVFGQLWGSSASEWSTTESLRQLPLNFTFEPKVLTVRIVANTLNGDCVVSFRDDGANVTNATVTVTSADTSGTKVSSAITATVAAGSQCCWEVLSTAAASGSATLVFEIEGYLYK